MQVIQIMYNQKKYLKKVFKVISQLKVCNPHHY